MSSPRIPQAPASMTGKWNHGRFLRACRARGITSAADLTRYINAARSGSAHTRCRPGATELVRSYFDARPGVLAKPRHVSAAWPDGRLAVAQAMHRMAAAGDLVRVPGGGYHLPAAVHPFADPDALSVPAAHPGTVLLYWTGKSDPTRGGVGKHAMAFELAVILNVSLDWLVSEDP